MGLPDLREELQLRDGGRERDGSPFWLIYDPPANRFYRIGWLEFELLSRWYLGDAGRLLASVSAETTLRPTMEDIEIFAMFLQQHQLLRHTSGAGTAVLRKLLALKDVSLGKWLIHNYLFFRIPLLHPDTLLDRIHSFLSPLFSWVSALILFIAGMAGLFLVVQQWDTFSATFVNTLTPAGMLGYVFMLVVAKMLHELGHALMAKHYGIRIPRMGIAFLVMFPVLYTDTGESWLLHDNRKRLMISASGIFAEAALASVSLFLWGVSDAGLLRDLFYFLAVVSLSRSLLVNWSPFMRFDGYYILSDLLDVPNLQVRAFALARHAVREFLFGIGAPAPEHFPSRTRVFLVLYAWATWVYRLVVFLGIAFAVYRYFFKPLGIFLMLVEIWYFIFLPIIRELVAWRKEVSVVSRERKIVMGIFVLLIAVLFLAPIRSEITAPAYLTAGSKFQVFAPFAAKVVHIPKDGASVKKGDILFELDAEELRFQESQARSQVAELRERISRFSTGVQGRDLTLSWSTEAAEKAQSVETQRAEMKRLVIRAERDGVLVEVNESLRPGMYVTAKDLLGLLVGPESGGIDAFVSERELARVSLENRARFLSSSPGGQILYGRVVEVDRNRISILPSPALADRHGGEIATQRDSERDLVPIESMYRVRIQPDKGATVTRMLMGHAVIEGRRISLAGRFLSYTASVLIRESGF